MRARSSSARAERKARMPLPMGVVRSSHCLSRALSIAPRAATRSMIRIPSIIERVARSHSASTSTSPGPSASIALSSSGRLTPSRPELLLLKNAPLDSRQVRQAGAMSGMGRLRTYSRGDGLLAGVTGALESRCKKRLLDASIFALLVRRASRARFRSPEVPLRSHTFKGRNDDAIHADG